MGVVLLLLYLGCAEDFEAEGSEATRRFNRYSKSRICMALNPNLLSVLKFNGLRLYVCMCAYMHAPNERMKRKFHGAHTIDWNATGIGKTSNIGRLGPV